MPGPVASADSSAALPPRPTRVHVEMVGLAVQMAVLLYLDRFAFGVAQPEIMGEIGLSEAQMGRVVKAFFYAYALAQVPAGWLADRLGPRTALTCYVGTWSLAVALMGQCNSLATLIAARILLGISQAGAYPAAAGLVKRWLPLAERGRANGAISMGGRAGGLLAAAFTPVVMAVAHRNFGLTAGTWRVALMFYGSLGILWAFVFQRGFRNTPQEHPRVNEAEALRLIAGPATRSQPSSRAASTPWLAIVSSLNVWLLCLINFLVNVGWIFIAAWLATYPRTVHAADIHSAGWLTAVTGLAGMAGCLAGGFLTTGSWRPCGLAWGRRIPGLLGSRRRCGRLFPLLSARNNR